MGPICMCLSLVSDSWFFIPSTLVRPRLAKKRIGSSDTMNLLNCLTGRRVVANLAMDKGCQPVRSSHLSGMLVRIRLVGLAINDAVE